METKLERLQLVFDILRTDGHVKNYSDLSKKINFSPSAILNIFSGSRGISPGFLQSLKDYYPAINIDYIVNGEGKPINGLISWNNPNKMVKYISEEMQISFGMKYNDESFLLGLPETYFDMGIPISTTDRVFDAMFKHPDDLFLKGDRLYTIATNLPKTGDSYFLITSDSSLRMGVCRQNENGQYIQLLGITPNETILPNQVEKYWEISGRITLKVRPADVFAHGISPREFNELMKNKKADKSQNP